MRKPRFEVDPTNLDRSADEARRAHGEGRISLAEWNAAAARIKQLRPIESFRRNHGVALYDKGHPDHGRRAAELQELYEKAYPDDPTAAS